MRAVVDSSVLVYLIDANAPAPIDPVTSRPVEHCQQRVEGLLDRLSRDDVEVIVPAPVLSELLVQAHGSEQEVLQTLRAKRAVRIDAFDEPAAIENALLRRTAAQRRPPNTKAQVSFDLQIMAIARVQNAEVIYSDDGQLRRRCGQAGIEVLGIAELPVPGELMQQGLPLGRPQLEAGGGLAGENNRGGDEHAAPTDAQ